MGAASVSPVQSRGRSPQPCCFRTPDDWIQIAQTHKPESYRPFQCLALLSLLNIQLMPII